MSTREDLQRYLIVDDDEDDIDFFCEAVKEINAAPSEIWALK